MASNSKKTGMKRLRKLRASAKGRKRAVADKTTPAFPIHKDKPSAAEGK